jgi:formamidopyrimidine-DNA glycosylase
MVAAGLIGRRITRAKVDWPRTIAMPSAAAFCDQIRDSAFEAIERRAKFILMALDKGRTMIVHLRMTGRFQWSGDGRGDDKHIHVS